MKTNSPICIITESSEAVATGHLSEACALAAALLEKGRDVLFYINADFPQGLHSVVPCPFVTYTTLEKEICDISENLRRAGCSAAVTDLRRVSGETVSRLKAAVNRVICIDELGGRRLDCDIIINPLIAESYHDYPGSSAEILTGPGYMIMKPGFARLNAEHKQIREKIAAVTICMGGMDTPGATIKTIHAIKDLDFSITVVAGGGFYHLDELSRICKTNNITVLKNINNPYDIFFESDIAFCSGGNVLYELACVGTPALTVYTNPHERASAEAFERRGFGRCLGQAHEILKSDITAGLDYFKAADVRSAASGNGKKIVDSKALERITSLL